MKKIFLVFFAFLGISFSINAQFPTTTAKPIANGCGQEGGMKFGFTQKQVESCNQHDRDYYNGVDKKKADDDFQKRSKIMGTAVKMATFISDPAYKNAQESRETSKQLQPTWEKENQQCLDADNYKVTYK